MKCKTPIDPETKIALSGEALEAALKAPDSPRCGYELATDDVFCPACGAKVENQSLSQGASVSCNSCLPTFAKGIAVLLGFFKGRAPRSALWIVWMIAAVLYAIVYCVVVSLVGNARNAAGVKVADTALAVAGFVISFCTLPVAVRRLHDRGNSGIALIPSVCFSFISLVFVLTGNRASITGSNASFACALVDIMAAAYNLFLFVALGLIRGTKGPNKYGPDPLETK